MSRLLLTAAGAALAAGPALAATGPFFSLGNTNFVVLIAFLVFVAILLYFKVPATLTGMLDKRAETIRSDLDEARALREEAQTVLAEFERKQKDVAEQAELIVEQAKRDAEAAAEQAKADLAASIERRIQAAEDQIASAEANAVAEVKNKAVNVAIAAAADVIAKNMSDQDASQMIDESIKTVDAKLH
ncbi:F0F1 ATP synthase subunit B [Tropicimonas isoalkanivorans]|uniref:ATP synthase subunit b n=1 Tax=Tropicimonas isoalkanivorans TaxID=441112 RepID=A0A1I1JP33_9RHOB|nr:F0F1 ATP synthase subunit B [Tropicimonas isoalkanivorans]SFC50314.1 ATP synthase F0 subcomplex B subunit [Tropicimonas isoalkanivorans]